MPHRRVDVLLSPQLFIHPPLGLPQPPSAVALDRLARLSALTLKLTNCLAQPRPPTVFIGQLLRQLVTATIAELLILGGVDLGGLLRIVRAHCS